MNRGATVAGEDAGIHARAPRRCWLTACLVLLAAHLLLSVARIPGKVYGKRAEEIERYRSEGAAHFVLDRLGVEGADAVDWIVANVPEDAVLLWRGVTKGAFEIMSGLVVPRLLVAEHLVERGAVDWQPSLPGAARRPLARGTLPDGRSGVLVIEGREDGVLLHVR